MLRKPQLISFPAPASIYLLPKSSQLDFINNIRCKLGRTLRFAAVELLKESRRRTVFQNLLSSWYSLQLEKVCQEPTVCETFFLKKMASEGGLSERRRKRIGEAEKRVSGVHLPGPKVSAKMSSLQKNGQAGWGRAVPFVWAGQGGEFLK